MCVQMSSELCVRRRRFIRVLKPLLTRKRSSSARINLNRHWNELEEVYARPAATTIPAIHFDTLLLHNELNDNAVNEAREAAAAAAAATATTFAAKTLLSANSIPPAEDEELLTPPVTPCHPSTATPIFNFGAMAMEDDAANLPLTPATPQAWDVFTFPSLMQQDAPTNAEAAGHHHEGELLS